MTVSLSNTPLPVLSSGTLTPSVASSWNGTTPVFNDLLVAVVQCQALTSTALGSTPAGWTLSSINETNSASTEVRTTVYTRVATGTSADNAPTWTATFTGTAADDSMQVTLYDLTDSSGQTPVFGPSGVAQGTSATVAPVTATKVLSPGCYALGSLSMFASTAAAPTWTTPAGGWAATSSTSNSSASNHFQYATWGLANPPAASTLTCSMAHTVITSTFEAAFVLVIAPPPTIPQPPMPGSPIWRGYHYRKQVLQDALTPPPLYTVLQSAMGTPTATASCTVVPANNLTASSKLVAFVSVNATSSLLPTGVSDGTNAFTMVPHVSFPASQGTLSVWVLDTPTLDVGTKPTITATNTGANGGVIGIMEVAGLPFGTTALALIDGTYATATGTTSPASGGAYSDTLAGELVIAAVGDGGFNEAYTIQGFPAASTINTGASSDAQLAVAWGPSLGGAEAFKWPAHTATTWGSLLFAFKPAPAPNVVFDSVGPSSAGIGSGASPTSLSWTHTTIGSSTAILASCAWDGPGSDTVTLTATCDGVSMTFIESLDCDSGGADTDQGTLWVFGILNRSAGAHPIVVSASAPASPDMEGGSIAATGVAAFGSPATASGTGLTQSVAVSSNTAGNLIVSFDCVGNDINSSFNTPRFIINQEGSGGSAAGNVGGSTAPATGSSVTMAWTSGSSGDPYALIAVEMQAATSGGNVSGAAALSGTGALTAQPVVNFSEAASLSGSGALAAQPVVNFAESASLSGAGTLTSQPAANFAGAASLSGLGVLAAQPVANFAETTTLSGLGVLTAAAAVSGNVSGAASLSGTGVLTSQPAVNFAGAASLSGAGSLTAQPVANFVTAASLSGTGSLTTQPIAGFQGAASLTGTGSLTAQPAVSFLPAPSLSGSGLLTSQPVVSFLAAPSLSGSGALTSQPVVSFLAAAALSGAGTLTAQAVVNFAGAASLSGLGFLTGQPVVSFTEAAALSGLGVLTAQPVVNFLAAASLSGTGVLTATAQTSGNVNAAAALSGTGSLTSQPVVNFASAATLSGTGTLTSQPVVNFLTAAALAGSGLLTAQPAVSFATAAALSGTGSLTSASVVNFALAAALTGTGHLTSAALAGFAPAAGLSGTGLLTSAALVNFLAAAALSGTGVLTATAATSGNILAAAALSGSGSLAPAVVVNYVSAAVLAGTGHLTAAVAVSYRPAPSLSGTGTLTSAVITGYAAAAMLAGTGVLTAAAALSGQFSVFFIAYAPRTAWDAGGALASQWTASATATAWETGPDVVTQWEAMAVTTDWQDS